MTAFLRSITNPTHSEPVLREKKKKEGERDRKKGRQRMRKKRERKKESSPGSNEKLSAEHDHTVKGLRVAADK